MITEPATEPEDPRDDADVDRFDDAFDHDAVAGDGTGELLLDEELAGGGDRYDPAEAARDLAQIRAARPGFVDDGEPAPAPVARPVFDTLDGWVSNFLLPVYTRDLSANDMTWCPEWWQHPEAYVRLEALWRAWEHLRHQPGTGMAIWLRDYLDQHMPVLLSATGPFNGCKPTGHGQHPIELLAAVPMPPASYIAAVFGNVYGGERMLQGRHGDFEIPEDPQ